MPIDSFREDEIDPLDTISPEEVVPNVAEEMRIPTDSVTNARQTASSSTQQSSFSSTPSSASSKFLSSSSESSEMGKMASGAARKMPRVTLKLRENETIPQMYMKAGIASYKKGNITTSVLAHGLSLEGLIFKTPEGTIKPWPQKWFFSDPSSDFQWKGPNQMPMMMYIVLVGLAGLASITIIFFYVQRKTSKRLRHDVEEPETESHEEDKSTLLGADNHEIEDKE
ncbi:hypothetical protein KPH14_008787 [Odynerus spinipes]|uniref:Uncharacterized protein n=1 Tax=Odynerus spinipes TaxID=1348599 RepID=A0AAD9VIL7_9HYME|nr:hypothetical protein KPH14_008787 [Odynerus spinipes]